MGELLFEIGVEEIPSNYIRPAVEALGRALSAKMADWGVPCGDIKLFATPRRLAVSAPGLPEKRPSYTAKVYGPPARAAFDSGGNPTKAAAGFAKSRGLDVSALKVEETGKGEYVYAESEEGGEPMAELLAAALPEIALGLPFPKSMVWGTGEVRFTRPIHWIVAVFDGAVIPTKVGGVDAGDTTRGHRFLGSRSITVTGRDDYEKKLFENHVMADIGQRKRAALEGAHKAAKANGAELLEDDELVETVAFLTEWPVPLWGSFDEEFLELPDELLIASMKAHQRMFAATGPDGKLTNGFVGVSNMVTKDDSVVVAGYRRVLRARLADAKFFFDEDRKRTLDHFAGKLDGVVYQKKLGTIGEKVERIENLAARLAEIISPDKKETVRRAAKLCKADLETLMVYEFPELQGVMGREYARYAGEPEEVCAAIYEHYLPRHAGDDLPSSDAGAIVGLADRLDTIVGCFGVGLEPTGATDPFALRRHTLGVIQIIFDKNRSISLRQALDFAADQLKGKLEVEPPDTVSRVLSFFQGRLKNFWTGAGVSQDVAEAVLAAGFDDLADANARTLAMAELKKRDFFEPLAITFKRVANITKEHKPGEINESLFEADVEKNLLDEARAAEAEVAPLMEKKDYLAALERIASLRGVVDRFFDEVLVMAEDDAVRANRLSLLCRVSAMFVKIADFSKVVA